MIKTFFLALLLVASAPTLSLSQEMFSSKVWAFSMQEPKEWLPMEKVQRAENLGKMDLDAQAQQLIAKNDKGFVLIAAYQKFDPNEHEGLIPGIQIQARKMSPVSFAIFKQQIAKSRQGIEKVFDDFKLIEDSETSVSGHKALKSIFTFTITTKDGLVLKARSTVYLIPRTNYFFQINFNDGSEAASDCSSEFDALVKTISIAR